MCNKSKLVWQFYNRICISDYCKAFKSLKTCLKTIPISTLRQPGSSTLGSFSDLYIILFDSISIKIQRKDKLLEKNDWFLCFFEFCFSILGSKIKNLVFNFTVYGPCKIYFWYLFLFKKRNEMFGIITKTKQKSSNKILLSSWRR